MHDQVDQARAPAVFSMIMMIMHDDTARSMLQCPMRYDSQLHITAVYNHPGCWTSLDMPNGQVELAQFQHQAEMICKGVQIFLQKYYTTGQLCLLLLSINNAPNAPEPSNSDTKGCMSSATSSSSG